MFNSKKHILGFTYIELMVVIGIILLISSVVLINVNTTRSKLRDTQRLNDMSQLQTALEAYRRDEGTYPAVITPGQALIGPTHRVTYLTKVPDDPNSAQNYTYTPVGSGTYTSYSICYNLEKTSGAAVAGWAVATPLRPYAHISCGEGQGYLNCVCVTCAAGGGGVCTECDDNNDCALCGKCSNGVCVYQSDAEDVKNECSELACSGLLKGFNVNVCEKYASATASNGLCDGSGSCHAAATACTGTATHQTCPSAGCNNATNCASGNLVASYPNLNDVCYNDEAQHSCSAGQKCFEGECLECVDNADCSLCKKCVDSACVNQSDSEDLKDECDVVGGCDTGNCSGSGTCGVYDDTLQHGCGTGQNCYGGECCGRQPVYTSSYGGFYYCSAGGDYNSTNNYCHVFTNDFPGGTYNQCGHSINYVFSNASVPSSLVASDITTCGYQFGVCPGVTSCGVTCANSCVGFYDNDCIFRAPCCKDSSNSSNPALYNHCGGLDQYGVCM